MNGYVHQPIGFLNIRKVSPLAKVINNLGTEAQVGSPFAVQILNWYLPMEMTAPRKQDVETVIRKMAEARDQALWKVLHFKCQKCHQIKPIGKAVGVEFPPENGGPSHEIWCRDCFGEKVNLGGVAANPVWISIQNFLPFSKLSYFLSLSSASREENLVPRFKTKINTSLTTIPFKFIGENSTFCFSNVI